MRTIDIARRMAELDQKEDAQKAYLLALQEAEGKNPEEEMEAASYIFFSEGDYEVAYTTFVSLYNRGCFQAELMDLLTQAFYLPNVEEQKKRYQDNCRLLSHYPYFFRDDFPVFEELPILFFPFNDQGFVPFVKEKNRFSPYVNFNDPVIDRYFFKDLEKPILAADVYSQYHLEYLNDNVRKSEWVGRENHIYLHYTNWVTFCSYLQCLDFQDLLQDEKLIFLFEDEIEQYPIDFKERFGIDYSLYKSKEIGIREIKRLIWHTQLATHNGGDFFNEILFGHPNLLSIDSLIFDDVKKSIITIKKNIKELKKKKQSRYNLVWTQLFQIKNPTDKDCLVALFMSAESSKSALNSNSRIAPALLFQPHFANLLYNIKVDENTGASFLHSEQYDEIKNSPLFNDFKYIKTFTPMRRITSSYGATIRFMKEYKKNVENSTCMPDDLSNRLLNRSFMIDKYDRLYRDSILVRFEDGKLNPKATFTALARFLDLPYTESMTYCSGVTGINPETLKGNDRGFDPAAIYRTYDEYVGDADREILEYFLRDAYEFYGYDFHYYHGEKVDEEWLKCKINETITLDNITRDSFLRSFYFETDVPEDQQEKIKLDMANQNIDDYHKNRFRITKILLRGLHFLNSEGQPLQMMKPLKLDPALLEQPLYH